MQRQIATSAFLIVVAAVMVAAQSGSMPQRGTSSTDLYVRATYEDPRMVPENVRVQLLTSGGAMIQETYLDGQGQVRFQVSPGSYRLRFSGPTVETIETSSFTVVPRMQTHTETVFLRPSQEMIQRNTSEATISAAEMAIPQKARKEFERGVELMGKSDFAGAEKFFQKAVQIYPNYAMAHNNLGVVALNANDRTRGEAAFRKAVELGSSSGSLNLGKLASIDGRHQEAEEFFQKSLSTNPANVEALLFIAKSQIHLGKREQALANARRVHDFPHEKYSICHVLAGSLSEELNHPEEALAQYRLFLSETPNSASAQRVREAINFIEGKLAKGAATAAAKPEAK